MSDPSTSTAQPAAQPATQTTTAALDELFKPVNRSDAPGLVVGIAHHGKIIYRRGFGLASVELAVANTPRTRMRIGSTSKHFTCLAALLLAEEGKLDIEAGVRRYLPELRDLRPEPTLRQLMTHTSGYRCYLDIGFISDGMAIKPKGSALAAQVRQTGVNFPPGERMIYCNGGYHLLSLIIERVSGMPFEKFLKDRIFEPLAMVDTDSVPSDFNIVPGMATLHIPLPDGSYRRGIFPTEEVRGEGAIISSVDDMLRWLAHLRGPKTVGSEASWQQIFTPTRLNNGTVNPYALGLMRHDYRGVEVIQHAGGVIGGSAQMLAVPSAELDIIIINNGGSLSPTETANKVIDIVLNDALTNAARSLPASDRFKPMLGTRYHAAESGFAIGFVESEGKLAISVLNSQGLPLHESGQTLRLSFEDVAVGPLIVETAQLASAGEAPAEISVSEAGNLERFIKLPATAPALQEVGAALVGPYRAPDLDADATIAFNGEALELKVFGSFGVNVMALEAFSADVFGWKAADAMLPLTGVLSVQRSEGHIVGFRIDTPRTRHVWFERSAAAAPKGQS